jgi:hypothetical protein
MRAVCHAPHHTNTCSEIYMDFFDHKDLGNHLLQLCPKVVKHPVYCDVFPVNTSNNLWVADFISQFIRYTPSGITIIHNTSNLILHNPVTSSGS